MNAAAKYGQRLLTAGRGSYFKLLNPASVAIVSRAPATTPPSVYHATVMSWVGSVRLVGASPKPSGPGSNTPMPATKTNHRTRHPAWLAAATYQCIAEDITGNINRHHHVKQGFIAGLGRVGLVQQHAQAAHVQHIHAGRIVGAQAAHSFVQGGENNGASQASGEKTQ